MQSDVERGATYRQALIFSTIAVVLITPLLGGAGEAVQKLRQLNSREIKAVLLGSYMRRTDLPGEISNRTSSEYFCITGDWELRGGRASIFGRNFFSGNEICVESPAGSAFCRRLFIDGEGRYYADIVDQGARTGRLAPVEISPEPDRSGCAPAH